mgnify:FL=1|tara:strand:- start:2605 stop:3750 length:1146 start_codon:yes stop_codon:yes gene_type:complete
MSKKIKVAIITERRADYSRFKPILNFLKKDKKFEYQLIVTGLHLLKEHGSTINEIKKDGFKILKKINMFNKGYKGDGSSMIFAMGNVMQALSKILKDIKPNIILSGFDIGANFSIVVAGTHLNIPVAHIQGGELSGSIDESLRHAMSKFSNYHFVANVDAKKRLIKMGEVSKNIHIVGCPSLDALKNTKEKNLNVLSNKFKFQFSKKYACIIQHPVTTENFSSEFQIIQTLKALKMSKIQSFIIMPNNDSGYKNIVKKIKFSKMKWTPSLSLSEYKTILKNCSFLIGNSSSGIHEAATFKKPVINIGTRQNKRLKSSNVINVGYDYKKINQKINFVLKNKKFLKQLNKIKNPYGDGKSAIKIIKILKKLDLKNNTQKTNTY